jgi:ubiquinone/menaquinone biosynthesis C-methylase UbiE
MNDTPHPDPLPVGGEGISAAHPDPLTQRGEGISAAEWRQERYYNQRAPEYEEVYLLDDVPLQRNMASIGEAVNAAMQGRRVLEVACGTGIWTARLARIATQVVAVDAAIETLVQAQSKNLPAAKVELRVADAFRLDLVPGEFDAGLANFFLSHVSKAKVGEFLDGFHRRIGAGALVVMCDSLDLPWAGGTVVRKPDSGDTYEQRPLKDGSQHEVIKNFYDAASLHQLLDARSTDLQVQIGDYFWCVSYTVR